MHCTVILTCYLIGTVGMHVLPKQMTFFIAFFIVIVPGMVQLAFQEILRKIIFNIL